MSIHSSHFKGNNSLVLKPLKAPKSFQPQHAAEFLSRLKDPRPHEQLALVRYLAASPLRVLRSESVTGRTQVYTVLQGEANWVAVFTAKEARDNAQRRLAQTGNNDFWQEEGYPPQVLAKQYKFLTAGIVLNPFTRQGDLYITWNRLCEEAQEYRLIQELVCPHEDSIILERTLWDPMLLEALASWLDRNQGIASIFLGLTRMSRDAMLTKVWIDCVESLSESLSCKLLLILEQYKRYLPSRYYVCEPLNNEKREVPLLLKAGAHQISRE